MNSSGTPRKAEKRGGFRGLVDGQPEDVHERAGYWRANAGVLFGQCEELLEALKVIDAELSVSGIDADAICDHAVGICWCSYNAARDAVRAALARAQSSTQPETEVGHE